MEASLSTQSYKEGLSVNNQEQPNWQRIILLFVLAYEGAGGLLGGFLLASSPDGKSVNMPVEMMHGSFSDFMIPGIILFGLGVLNSAAFFSVLKKSYLYWLWAITSMVGFLTWFWIELAVLQELHWLHAMWGLPVIIGFLAAIPLVPKVYRRKAFLYCGILSSILYVAINIIVPLQWDGYSHVTRVISEFSAVDSPTRVLWMVLATPYTFLILAFAWGVYTVAEHNQKLRMVGKFLLAYGALGLFWPFAPMHMRETLAAGGGTFSDTMHIVLGAATQIFYFLALGYAALAFGKRFKIYSIITFMLLLVFGTLTFLESPGLGKNEPTPFIGLWERINIGLFLVWIVVLAIILLREKAKVKTDYLVTNRTTLESRVLEHT